VFKWCLTLKIYSDCILCLLNVRLKDVNMLWSRETDRVRVSHEIIKLLGRVLDKDYDNPPMISTVLFRYVKKVSKNEDPYRDVRFKVNKACMRLYKSIAKNIARLSDDKRYLASIKASLLGNALDLGVANYKPPSTKDIIRDMKTLNIIGDGHLKILKSIRTRDVILYLLDNAGEAALDKLYAEELRRRGYYVIGVVKGGAFQNDVTIDDVKTLELEESFDEVQDTGCDCASIFLGEISNKLKRTIEESSLIIAKGMAHYEYVTEIQYLLDKPVLYMLKAKCKPVAQDLKVKLGAYIAMLKM